MDYSQMYGHIKRMGEYRILKKVKVRNLPCGKDKSTRIYLDEWKPEVMISIALHVRKLEAETIERKTKYTLWE